MDTQCLADHYPCLSYAGLSTINSSEPCLNRSLDRRSETWNPIIQIRPANIRMRREFHSSAKFTVCLKDAGTEDWDGEGALALAPETADLAQKLIDEFPPHVSRPDVNATPHGEVDFDWVIDRDVMLTVSVGPSKEDCICRVVSWRTLERLRTVGRHAAAICELLL